MLITSLADVVSNNTVYAESGENAESPFLPKRLTLDGRYDPDIRLWDRKPWPTTVNE